MMKKILLIFVLTGFIGSYSVVNASRVADAIDTLVDSVVNSIEKSCNEVDRVFNATSSAYDAFGRSIDRAVNRMERAVHNMGRRAELSVEIAQDYRNVSHCERAFLTSA